MNSTLRSRPLCSNTSFEVMIQQNKWTWKNTIHLGLFRTHPGFIIFSFYPLWQIFWPMYHRPSKSAGCSIFQYVKNKAQTGPEQPQASGTPGSFMLQNRPFKWSVMFWHLRLKKFQKKFDFRLRVKYTRSVWKLQLFWILEHYVTGLRSSLLDIKYKIEQNGWWYAIKFSSANNRLAYFDWTAERSLVDIKFLVILLYSNM